MPYFRIEVDTRVVAAVIADKAQAGNYAALQHGASAKVIPVSFKDAMASSQEFKTLIC